MGAFGEGGDEARLTAIVIKEDKIRFEINGGPVKKQKWYNHIQVGVGGTSPVSPSDAKRIRGGRTLIWCSIITCRNWIRRN